MNKKGGKGKGEEKELSAPPCCSQTPCVVSKPSQTTAKRCKTLHRLISPLLSVMFKCCRLGYCVEWTAVILVGQVWWMDWQQVSFSERTFLRITAGVEGCSGYNNINHLDVANMPLQYSRYWQRANGSIKELKFVVVQVCVWAPEVPGLSQVQYARSLM